MASSTNSTSVPSGMLPSVINVTRLPFDLHCETDLSALRIAESRGQFRLHHTAFYIRVSAHIFWWVLRKPRILLLERTLCDTRPGYWEPPGGAAEDQDETPGDALKREVGEETGLQLSQVTHTLPTQTWTRSKGREDYNWVGLPCIIKVSELETFESRGSSQRASQPVLKWEDIIRLNPEEHQNFAWATEEEVRCDKYKMFGNHKETALKAFAAVTENCSV